MEVAVAVEQRRDIKETPVQRLLRESVEFFQALSRLVLLAAVLGAVLLVALVTLDIPVRWFDHWFANPAMQPGEWLTEGGVFFWIGTVIVVLYARRFGGEEAARAVTAAWTIAAVGVFAGLSYLAPELENGDLPRLRAVIGVVVSAMAGQYVAPAVYDLIRGGGPWWRAPFFSLLFAAAAHVILYFPIIYAGRDYPWANWMVADFALKAVMAALFLGPYFVLRRRLKPRGGLGG